MYLMNSFKQHQSAFGRQCRPTRRALQTQCLHKALRLPTKGPITAPADVVYECLTLLRRPDLESLVPFFPAATFDPSIRCVRVEVGGQVVEEAGPLACCHHFMDTAARRVLPGHLLRRGRVLSSVHLGSTCQMRVALTACTGEEAVFVWRLRREAAEEAAAATAAAADAAAPLGSSRALTAHSRSEGECGDQAGGRHHHQQQQQQQRGLTQAMQASILQCPGDASQPPATSASPSHCLSPTTADPTAVSERGWNHPDAASSSCCSTIYTATNSCTSTSNSNSNSNTDGVDGDVCGRKGRSANDGIRQSSGPVPSEPVSLRSPAAATTSGFGVYDSGGGSDGLAADGRHLQPQQQQHVVTTWVVESILRDDSRDEEEMPYPSPLGRGPHPRCSPEQLVKAQLAALRRGDVAGAASFNLWCRSTSGGWDLHLSAFRSMLRQPSYHVLLTSDGAELGPSALLSGRRMVQEVRLLPSTGGGGGTRAGAAAASAAAWSAGGGLGGSLVIYQLCMQASGCWLVEGIRVVQ